MSTSSLKISEWLPWLSHAALFVGADCGSPYSNTVPSHCWSSTLPRVPVIFHSRYRTASTGSRSPCVLSPATPPPAPCLSLSKGLLARMDSGTSAPHPFLHEIALNPALACFCCLPAALQAGLPSFLIGTPPIGSSRLVDGSLHGMFHGGSHASPFQRTSVSRRSEQVDDLEAQGLLIVHRFIALQEDIMV